MWNNLEDGLKTQPTVIKSSYKHNLQTTTFKKYNYLVATLHLVKYLYQL